MRSLLVKSSLIIAIVLAMTSGVTLASASSKPGMFLYPVKRMSQEAAGIFTSVTSGEIPTAARQDSSPADDVRGDATQEPTATETPHMDRATTTAIPVPTLVKTVDKITASVEPGHEITSTVEPDHEITATVEPGDNPDTDKNKIEDNTLAPDNLHHDLNDDQGDHSPGDDQNHGGLDSGQNEDSHQPETAPSSLVNDEHFSNSSSSDHQSSGNSGSRNSDSSHNQDNSGGDD